MNLQNLRNKCYLWLIRCIPKNKKLNNYTRNLDKIQAVLCKLFHEKSISSLNTYLDLYKNSLLNKNSLRNSYEYIIKLFRKLIAEFTK